MGHKKPNIHQKYAPIGLLSDRHGLRWLVPICTCFMALGLLMASRIDSLWMLYISYGLVFAIGITGVGDLPPLPVISRWYIRKRGTAIGIAMAGMGLHSSPSGGFAQ